jgi:hypothetical protein
MAFHPNNQNNQNDISSGGVVRVRPIEMGLIDLGEEDRCAGFNTSVIIITNPADGRKYKLLAIRCIVNKDGIEPGINYGIRRHVERIYGQVHVGKNFPWGCWRQLHHAIKIRFFIAEHDPNNENSYFEIKECRTNYGEIRDLYRHGGDPRLSFHNDHGIIRYLYGSSNPATFCEVTYDFESNFLTFHQNPFISTYLDRTTTRQLNNAQIMSIEITPNSHKLTILDWYTEKGIQFRKISVKTSKYFNEEEVSEPIYSEKYGRLHHKNGLTYDGYGHSYPDGMTKKIPLLSFSTPVIRIDPSLVRNRCSKNPSVNQELYFGVGHSKIANHKPHSDPKIENFKESIHSEFRTRYGENYVPHFGYRKGYIYMMYFFYIIYQNGKPRKMFLSDSYYFKPINDSRTYHFSLLFPTGLVLLESGNVLVTCGEGDYYPVSMTFNLQSCLSACIHDAQRMDFDQYNFHLVHH